MNNSNDQAQFAKDVYQVPDHKPEAFDAPKLDEANVGQRFAEIARHEISRSFDEITQELDMAANGIDRVKAIQPEVLMPHPDALHIRGTLTSADSMRTARHNELFAIQTKRGFLKILDPVLQVRPLDSAKTIRMKEAIFHDLIDQDSKSGIAIFPTDPDVLDTKFFHLRNDDYDEIFHQQASAVRAKDFTNSYVVTDYAIQKSSTFFDEVEGRVKNVSVVPADEEIKNLKHAVVLYHDYVAKKVYAKPATPRRLFGLKSDHDLAA